MPECDGKDCQNEATISYRIFYGSREVKVKRFLRLCDACYRDLVGVD